MQKSGSQLQDSETSAEAVCALCLFAKMMAVRDSVEDLIVGVPTIRYQMG